MTTVMISGAIALAVVVVVLVVVVALRRGKAAPPVAAPEEPIRRRSVGASLTPDELAETPPVEAFEQRGVEREKRSIGLTPWQDDSDVASSKTYDLETSELEAEIEAAAEPFLEEEPLAEPPHADPFAEATVFAGPAPDLMPEPPEPAPPSPAPLSPEPEPLSPEPPLPESPEPESLLPAPPLLEATESAPFDEPEPDEPSQVGDEPPSILSQLKKKKKSGGANPLAGAIEGGPGGGASAAAHGVAAYGAAVTGHAAREVTEEISLVLRRQVPPRLDEGPRSWLGGLPMMTEGVEWPRSVAPERLDDGPLPLNFVAQIACADLPADLWGGVGPRDGWLLFFLNPRDEAGDDERIFRVLWSAEIGSERSAPDDLPPVAEAAPGSGDYPYLRSGEAIPGTWRRWPLDLVEQANEAFDDGYRIVVTPKDFSAPLYDGAEVASGGKPDVSGIAPFSWRGALYVVDSILRQLGEGMPPQPLGPGIREALSREGFIASIVPELRAREAHWLSEGEGAILTKEEPLRERERELKERLIPVAAARKDSIDRLASFIADHPNAAAIAARIDADAAAEAEWRGGARARLESLRVAIVDHDLDSGLSDADWSALRDHLAADGVDGWSAVWTSRNSDFPVSIEPRRHSLLDLGGAGIEAAAIEVGADYYGDPARRDLVPDALVTAMEPHWRRLSENRPHRIGGFHDGIQSDPEPGAQSEVLLLQLASDEAMGMMWGDAGAYYIFISPADLATGRLGEARIQLENP